MPSFGIMLLPGRDEHDDERCTAQPCEQLAICRVFTQKADDPDDIGTNVVCAFHAIVYTGAWLAELMQR